MDETCSEQKIMLRFAQTETQTILRTIKGVVLFALKNNRMGWTNRSFVPAIEAKI